MGFALSDIPSLALDSFKRTFPAIFVFFDSLIEKAKAVFDFISKAANFVKSGISKAGEFLSGGEINNAVNNNINTNQSPVPIGGSLGIDIRGLPTGSSTNFTPAPGNQLPVGINSSFATP